MDFKDKKLRLPKLSWTQCKYILIFFIAIVAIFITITLIYQGGIKNRFSFLKNYRRKPHDPSNPKMSRYCKQLLRKESVNWNYFYYYEDLKTRRSIIWCKVPKAGSTTLTKMFLRLAGAKNISNTTRIHKLLRNYYPRLPSNVMKHRVQTSKTFIVVRDPFERILSAYRDKLESYQRDLEYRDGYYYDNFGQFMVNQSKSLASNANVSNFTRKEPTFQEFVHYLIKTSVARYDEHWMPITRLCSPCSVDFNVIVKMEKFAYEIRKPLNYAKINLSNLGWSHKTGTSTNKKIVNAYFKNLTLTDVKKLYTKYKQDFQLFGYSPYKYFRLFSDDPKTTPKLSNNESMSTLSL